MDTIHDEGWVWLWRKSIHSRVFQNEGLWKVWTWCLMRANYDDAWVPVNTGKGTTEVFIKRGQFIFGRKTAGKALKMSPRTVHKRMLKLQTMQNLTLKSDTHYSIVTVLNYKHYQQPEKDKGTPKGTPKGQPRDTDNKKEEFKELKNGRPKDTDPRVKEFFSFWGETFTQKTGQPYVFSFGKDGALIKKLFNVHSPETLQQMTGLFFKDEQCQRRGLTIGIFFQEINRLLSLKAMDPLAQARRERSGGTGDD